MRLNSKQKNIIKEHALEQIPNECCGIILSDSQVVKCINHSPTPQTTFHIKYNTLKDIDQDEIVAFYHSHPSGLQFSMTDKYFSHKRNITAVLYSVQEDDFNFYEPTSYFELPLIGRDFITNEVDCITLVRDYYGRYLNIDIPDIIHPVRSVEPANWMDHEEFWSYNRRTNREFVNLFESRGFKEVDSLKKHDLILSDNGTVKAFSHCAVYIDDSKVVHHPYPGESIQETLRSFENNSKILYMRHQNMMS